MNKPDRRIHWGARKLDTLAKKRKVGRTGALRVFLWGFFVSERACVFALTLYPVPCCRSSCPVLHCTALFLCKPWDSVMRWGEKKRAAGNLFVLQIQLPAANSDASSSLFLEVITFFLFCWFVSLSVLLPVVELPGTLYFSASSPHHHLP